MASLLTVGAIVWEFPYFETSPFFACHCLGKTSLIKKFKRFTLNFKLFEELLRIFSEIFWKLSKDFFGFLVLFNSLLLNSRRNVSVFVANFAELRFACVLQFSDCRNQQLQFLVKAVCQCKVLP